MITRIKKTNYYLANGTITYIVAKWSKIWLLFYNSFLFNKQIISICIIFSYLTDIDFIKNKKIEPIMKISILKRIFSYYNSSLLNGDICKEKT